MKHPQTRLPIALSLTEEEAAELEYFLRREAAKATSAKLDATTYAQRQIYQRLANRLGEALLRCLSK